jgi:PAS domain S-box-containing protein
MDQYQIISYPLYAGGVLEVLLGIALLKQAPRDRARRAAATLFFSAAGFVLFTAISYTLESQGRSFNFFNRASWIGWFMIPACLQFAFYLQDENSRAARITGLVLYPFWGLVFALTLFTDLVEPGDRSLIPFVDLDGPLEKPLRVIGTIMALWLLVVLYRARRRLTGVKKAQMEMFFYGTLFFNVGCILIAGILPLFGAINPAFTTFVSLFWVAITYYAVTRRRLFDVRLMLSRVLNIALLSFLFAAGQVALFKLLAPVAGESGAILLSLSINGLFFFGTQFSRNVQQWTQRLVLKGRYDYQRVLKESIQAIITVLRQDELLDYIIASIKKSLRVEKVCIVLCKQDRRLSRETEQNVERGSRCPANDAVIAWLQRTGRIIEREELEQAPAADTRVMVSEYMASTGAELIIPLSYKGELKGYIVIGQKGNKDPYVQSDFDLLEMLAGQTVVAIENARLFEDARRARVFFRESEEKFRTLAETAAMAIFIHQGGNFLYANRAAEVIGGYAIDEYLTMNFMSLVHPDFVELVKTRARERLGGSGDVPTQYEFKIRRKNGEERWVLMTAGVSEFEGKAAVIGTLIDITARKHAEEERYRMSLLIENSSDYIAMSDMEGHMLFVNQAGRRLVGLDNDADVRKLIADDFYFQEDLPLLQEYRRRNDWRGEFRLRHFKTGAPIPIEWYIFNVTDEETGKPIARAAVMRDIADLKRAREERERYYEQLQQALRSFQDSEAKFRTLAETTSAIIFIHRGGKGLYANPAGVAIAGYTNEEFRAMDFWKIIHPEYRELAKERGRACLLGDKLPPEYEFKIITKKGEERWVNMTAGMINYEGEPAVIGTLFDITDRKRAEEEKIRLFEHQIAVEKRHVMEKEKILMDLHDGIGGITTNISILSELAQKAADIEKIKSTLFTISRLSREGISEIRSFMHSLDSRDLNWRTFAAELRSQGINMVEPHGISFTAETDVEEVPEQPGSLLWVNLFKIYKETLTNVIKHSKADAVAVTLKVARDGLLLAVRDNGVWKESAARGRGLANMEKRAKEIGGKVDCSTGNGTRVSLAVPIPLKYPETGMDL